MLRRIGSCSGLAWAIFVSAVMAQEPPQRRGPGIIFSPGSGPTELLRSGPMRDEVRKELAIGDEQTKQMDEAFAPLKELDGDFLEAQSLAPAERQKRMMEIAQKRAEEGKLAEVKLNQILTPEQRARWKQLWLQFQGNAVLLQPEIAKELGLSGEQQEKMRAIAASLRPQPGQPKPEDFSQQERQQFFADLNARREKALRDMLAVLTEQQQARFAEMKGKEFPFPPQYLGSSRDQPSGQQAPGGPVQNRPGGGPGFGRVENRLGGPALGTPVDLLRRPRVCKELAIGDEQMQQIEEAFAPLREAGGDFREAQNLSPEDRRARAEEISKKAIAANKLVAEKVDGILNPDQRARLKQLWVQSQGAYALKKPEVAKELGLTQEQQDKIGEILKVVQDHRQKVANPRPGQPGFQDLSQAELDQWNYKLRELEEKADTEAVAILSDEQKAKLAKMKGDKFDFPRVWGVGIPPESRRPPGPSNK
ncbi:MAG TPA: hypothetical protein VG826_26280 [Pirellulales bacterium]|nr:hypothetical protein [Pirellulales bacterium]